MSADDFQVDQIFDHFGQVPENLLFDTTASSDEKVLFALLTTYDYRKTGEAYPSQETLGKRLGWSLAKTKRVLRKLGARGAVEVVRRRREPALYRLVARMVPATQDGSDVSRQEPLMAQNVTLDGSSVESTPLTNENLNERAAQARPPRATRIPIPFDVTDEMVEWAEREIPDFNWDRETPKFMDHWRGKSGKDATKADWPATWRNWMRRASEGMR